MSMSATFTKAMIENNNVTLPLNEAKSLLVTHKESDHFVASTFKDLYYTDDENDLIDTLRTNIAGIHDQYKRAIAMTALIRACTKSVLAVSLHTLGIVMMMDEKICKRHSPSNFSKQLTQ